MNQLILKGTIVAALLNTLSLTWAMNPSVLSWHSDHLAIQLKHYAHEHHASVCAEDVLTAASYMERSAQEIKHHQWIRARTSMNYAQSELKQIASTRSYCVALSGSIIPYMHQIRSLETRWNEVPEQLFSTQL